MIDLFTYLFESTFKNNEFYKHSYAKEVINKIISTGQIRLGDKGDSIFKVQDDIFPSVQKELSEIVDRPDKESFDVIMKKHNLPSWNKIFKGDFSGYVNGLASKNKGNAFEDEYVTNFSEYAPQLEKALGLQPYTFENCVPEAMGSENQSRPLTYNGNQILIGGNHATVGESVVDVFIKDKDGNPYNLSLKYGTTVTFCNAGVKRLFNDRTFKEYEIKKEYTADTFNGVSGNELLKMLCMEPNKFAETFIKYGTGDKNESIDVTKELKRNREFINFLESVIGYNYILVHKHTNGKIVYVDLRTEKDMKKLIGNIKSAEVQYGGGTGKGKRVDLVIELSTMTLKINIRSKDGGLLPTHIMCDYTIHH